MSIAMMVIGAIMAAMSIASPFVSNAMNKKANEEMREYNSPVNQMSRLEEAGLNPNLAATNGFSTITQTPQMSNPAESIISGLGGMASAYSKAEQMEYNRANLDLRESQLELNQIKTDIQKNLAEQAIAEGRWDIALKALTYDTAIQTQPAVVDKAFADAGFAGNRKSMSDVDLASYEEYRDWIVGNEMRKGLKMDAETYYLTAVKPQLDWYKAKTSRMSTEEMVRHNINMETLREAGMILDRAHDKEMYDYYLEQAQLAKDKHDWDKAHYWIDKAFSILGAATQTGARMYGIPVPR